MDKNRDGDGDRDLITLISNRHSVRGFSAQPVPPALIHEILDVARNCPTGGNMQPWNIAVVSGQRRQALAKDLLQAFDERREPNPDYDYYPKKDVTPYGFRRHAAGVNLYRAAHIKFTATEADWPAVMAFVRKNYDFFGAGTALIFHINRDLTAGAHIDIGLMMQNIILLAEYHGLKTCPQAAIANYPDIVRRQLNLGEECKILCALSLGYADPAQPVNQARISKESVEKFTKWYD